MPDTSALAAVALYAGLLALILCWLAAHIGKLRGKLKISIGDNGHPRMIRAMRGQANFVEYVPMALILFVIMALLGAPALAIHILGAALVAGRVLHALHFTAEDAPGWQRAAGTALTLFTVMAAGLGAVSHAVLALIYDGRAGMIDPAKLTEQLLDAARKAGAEAADAIAVEREDLGVSVRAGALEEAERSESVDFGLRVLIGARQACVSASDPRPAVLAELAERAVAMAREAPEDPHCGLPDAAQIAADWPELDLSDPAAPPAPGALEDIAREVEAAAMATPGVSQTESCSASWGRAAIHLAATNGFAGGYASTRSGFSASAIAGTGLGMESDWDFASRRFAADLPDPAQIGRRAGERAVERLGSRKPPSGAFPVIFDARVAPSIIGAVIGAANGAAIARGSSWLLDKMGERVLPVGFDIFEDPLIPRGPASRPFDGEGLATRAKKIVEDGVLRTWLMDCRSARKLGLASTANATRGLSSPPGVGSTNIRLTTGSLSREALIRETGTGLLVTSMMGRGANPTTGDYSRGASGFWIENGEIAYPVNEATVAGALPKALLTLTAADDIDLSKAMAAPSIRLEGLTIAGD